MNRILNFLPQPEHKPAVADELVHLRTEREFSRSTVARIASLHRRLGRLLPVATHETSAPPRVWPYLLAVTVFMAWAAWNWLRGE
jgi:hypothetical protein